ncbi:M56/M15 family metallopeptidase [Geosporobacter ferrireducens]|uniref:M56/M15 family metallopeptidase n=1 Tax=Geosporobacter ferrireducens TaxID=1424294 RepID=UPI0023526732|nr:M56/M15 family metallopeptidase [Geosporobacter ferrireducens]
MRSSFMASILILLLLLIRKLFYRRFGARFLHSLWILVLLRLLIPVTFESPFSIFNLLDMNFRITSMVQNNNETFKVLPFAHEPLMEEELVGSNTEHSGYQDDIADNENNLHLSILKVLSLAWLMGFLVLAVFSYIITIRFKHRTRNFKPLENSEIQFLVEYCRKKVKIKRPISVYMNPYFRSPCISGIIKPRIYLPEDICCRADQVQLQHILLHELSHYKRKDLWSNLFSVLTVLVHWFNPLVWLAVKKMRYDREIACDAYVMEMLEEEETMNYGMTIIHFSNLFSNKYKQLYFASFFEINSQLERRITMIKMFKKGSYQISAAVIICCIVIAAITLTNPVSSQNTHTKNPSILANNTIVSDPTITAILNSKAKDKLVLVDAGHGGEDPGAIYTKPDNSQVKEKDLNLQISLLLYDMLKTSGIKVELTRQEDIAMKLSERAELANKLNASLLVSIHIDANADPSENGTTTLFNPSMDYASYGITGERAAQLLQEELIGNLETTNQGIQKEDRLILLKNTKMPSSIVHIAYITNESDRQKLMTEEFKTQAAQALHDGIIKALNEMASTSKK